MSTTNRVMAIDVMRGTALLGILVMNIQSFAMPHAAYLNPTVFGSLAGLDGVAWCLGRLFFDFKFISIFSALFGASLVLGGHATHPRRRLMWLVVFGLLHGYLIWFGDILFTYGVVGLLLLPARTWRSQNQIFLGLGLILISSLIPLMGHIFFAELPQFLIDDVRSHYDMSSVAAEVRAFQSSWIDQLPIRAQVSFANQITGTLLDAGWRAAGCMLLGMAALRLRVFEGAIDLWPWLPLSLMGGLGLTGSGLWIQWSSAFALHDFFLAQTLHEVGAIGIAAAIVLGVSWLANRFHDAWITQATARLGRVAFTAYLMQSVVGTWVFGGHGLGLYGSWSRTLLFVAPFLFWSLQLAMAWWWTQRFRQGPLEALWRGLVRWGQGYD